jgi:pyruvate,water dikinase
MQADELGGKASNLAILTHAGLPVPPWFCITSSLFASLCERLSPLLDEQTADPSGVRQMAGRLNEAIRNEALSESDVAALYSCFDELFTPDSFVAVRSSAVGEDSSKDSFAGQMDTFLYVTRDNLSNRVIDCFASAFSERALLYRHLRSRVEVPRAGVLVQQMINASVSGVMFTANPTTGDRDEAVVTAGYGLGEGVVGGLVETDTWFLDLHTGAVRERVIVQKQSQIAFDRAAGSGTSPESVAKEKSELPVLSDAQLANLANLGRTIELLYGAPQDIEWAIDGSGRLHLLQSRPITTLTRGRQTVFDNSNVVESYPGLSTPLTFSYARNGYYGTFKAFLESLGVPSTTLSRYASRHSNLVALVNGRIYYNLLNWYSIFELCGIEWMIPAWERALGLPRRYVRPVRRTLPQKLQLLRVKLRFAWHFLRIQREVRSFLAAFQNDQAWFRAHDLESMDAHQLLDMHDELALRVRGPYSVSVMNDAFTQQLHALLGKLIVRYRVGDLDMLRNALLCGESGMESVEPVRSGLELAMHIRRNPKLAELFESPASAEEVLSKVEAEPAFSSFRQHLATHLDLYGDRTVNELKLETPPAQENPEFIVAVLRNYLRGGQNFDTIERHELEIRGAAERTLSQSLRRRPVQRLVFNYVLRRVRTGTRDRETLRLSRSRAFGWSKRAYRQIANRFVEAGLLDTPDDVFYLSEEEIAGTVRGHALTHDLRSLTAIRKREYAELSRADVEGRVTAYGIVGARRFGPPPQGQRGYDGTQELKGQGCSPGRAVGRAKVILNPADELTVDGEILIAPMTDPGWVFLMVASKGLVSEKGSLLSHTAIIGRELGIPTVVGVKDATRRIANGQTIEIDGDAGTVRFVPNNSVA